MRLRNSCGSEPSASSTTLVKCSRFILHPLKLVRSKLIPTSRRRSCRHPHHLLFCGRLPPLRPLALGEGGHRLLRSHKRGKRQCTLESFGAWPIVRRIRDHRDEGLPEVVTLDPAVQSELNQNQRRTAMTQKVIEVVGTSKDSFAKAAENAVAEAAKTVRGMKWARVAEVEMELDGKKIAKYRATTKIYFDIER